QTRITPRLSDIRKPDRRALKRRGALAQHSRQPGGRLRRRAAPRRRMTVGHREKRRAGVPEPIRCGTPNHTIRREAMNKLIVALMSFASLLFVAGFAQAADTSAWSEGGLVKKDVPGIDTAYVRPGASLGEYKKVLLKPVQVSFRRGWLKQPLPGSKFPINPADAQDIRDKVAKLMQDEFRKELEAGGYQMTDAPADDVLQGDAAGPPLVRPAPPAAH